MTNGAESLAFFLIGPCKALDSFDGTGGGPGNGRVTADRASHSTAVFLTKMISVLVSAMIIRAGDGKSDFAAVMFFRSMTG